MVFVLEEDDDSGGPSHPFSHLPEHRPSPARRKPSPPRTRSPHSAIRGPTFGNVPLPADGLASLKMNSSCAPRESNKAKNLKKFVSFLKRCQDNHNPGGLDDAIKRTSYDFSLKNFSQKVKQDHAPLTGQRAETPDSVNSLAPPLDNFPSELSSDDVRLHRLTPAENPTSSNNWGDKDLSPVFLTKYQPPPVNYAKRRLQARAAAAESVRVFSSFRSPVRRDEEEMRALKPKVDIPGPGSYFPRIGRSVGKNDLSLRSVPRDQCFGSSSYRQLDLKESEAYLRHRERPIKKRIEKLGVDGVPCNF